MKHFLAIFFFYANISFALPVPWNTDLSALGSGFGLKEAREKGRANFAHQLSEIYAECKSDSGQIWPRIMIAGKCLEEASGKGKCTYYGKVSCLDAESVAGNPYLNLLPSGWNETVNISRQAYSRDAAFKIVEAELEVQRTSLKTACDNAKGFWIGDGTPGGSWSVPRPGVAEAYLEVGVVCYIDPTEH